MILRKLLIFKAAQYASSSKLAERRYASGTREGFKKAFTFCSLSGRLAFVDWFNTHGGLASWLQVALMMIFFVSPLLFKKAPSRRPMQFTGH